ncbi:MAG TPA: base excision DNA repair protein [Terriglobales bacterium]
MNSTQPIRSFYSALAEAYGPQHWWPAKTRFEVIVGAYLTQNTSWKNVERALKNLRSAGVLNVKGIREINPANLEQLLRPSGYFRQKAARLKAFVTYLDANYGGSLRRMFAQPTTKLRVELLGLNGVGPETADAILLYAGDHPVFVVDAYARRILDRHHIVPFATNYDQLRHTVEHAFADEPPTERARHFNELHALIVMAGKNHCNTSANCAGCPLEPFLP